MTDKPVDAEQRKPEPRGEGREGESLQEALRRLFNNSERFRLGLLIFDAATVFIFMALTFFPTSPWTITIDAILGVLLLMELVLRFYIARSKRAYVLRLGTVMDVLIVVTLLIPTLTGNFVFLRLLRAVRIVRGLRVLREMRARGGFFLRHGELIASAFNLILFIFVTSAVVYELQVGRNPDITNIVDAVYFTVTTLTTTGFGDITLVGNSGRLLSVVIMVIGISLFVKLAQAIFRPNKVHVECQVCGLSRHDPDAVHCKHCGSVVHINTEGL